MSQHIELIYLLSAIRDSIRLRRDEAQINFGFYGAEATLKKEMNEVLVLFLLWNNLFVNR